MSKTTSNSSIVFELTLQRDLYEDDKGLVVISTELSLVKSFALRDFSIGKYAETIYNNLNETDGGTGILVTNDDNSNEFETVQDAIDFLKERLHNQLDRVIEKALQLEE